MGNLDLVPKRDLSPFRRIALGTWRTAGDPSVYGALSLRMEPALAYLDAFREATGRRLTVTHLVARAVAAMLEEMPDANAIIRWNRIYLRRSIDVFLQIVLEDEKTGQLDLSGAVIRRANEKSLLQIVEELERKALRVRDGSERTFKNSRGTFSRLPYALISPVLKGISFLTQTLNLDLRWAGIPKDAFGSVMITNIGSLGLEEAFVPLVPYSRVPLLIAVGAVSDEPVVEDGEVVAGKVMRVCATFDHRVLDGAHAAKMSRTLRAWFERPFDHFGAIPTAEAPGDAAPGAPVSGSDGVTPA